MAEWRAALHADAAAQQLDVWPEHWHAVQIFLAMETQWRVAAGMAGLVWLGLDYSAIDAAERIARPHVPRALRMHRRGQRPQLHDQLRLLEQHGAAARNKG